MVEHEYDTQQEGQKWCDKDCPWPRHKSMVMYWVSRVSYSSPAAGSTGIERLVWFTTSAEQYPAADPGFPIHGMVVPEADKCASASLLPPAHTVSCSQEPEMLTEQFAVPHALLSQSPKRVSMLDSRPAPYLPASALHGPTFRKNLGAALTLSVAAGHCRHGERGLWMTLNRINAGQVVTTRNCGRYALQPSATGIRNSALTTFNESVFSLVCDCEFSGIRSSRIFRPRLCQTELLM